MKATFEIPDELYRKVKAKSALEGQSVRKVAIDLFCHWLGEPPTQDTAQPSSLHEQMQRYCGLVDSGVTDLATNPSYLDDFGLDSSSHR